MSLSLFEAAVAGDRRSIYTTILCVQWFWQRRNCVWRLHDGCSVTRMLLTARLVCQNFLNFLKVPSSAEALGVCGRARLGWRLIPKLNQRVDVVMSLNASPEMDVRVNWTTTRVQQ
jgi:hypothetical protein